VEKCGNLLSGAEARSYELRGPAVAALRGSDSRKMHACSAYAGDYEDPDRTAGEEFDEMLAGDEAERGEDEAER